VLKQKIRDEQRFASLDALKEQIAKDVVTARQFFGLKTPV
jgi:riboflavin kinase/FMN adenylyltransferase